MIQIRPVSDLRNKFPEIEQLVENQGEPVFLTKNGHGAMVVMSIDKYTEIMDEIEYKLDEAELEAESISIRYTHEEVMESVRARIHGK